jgi:hypothetical protein
LHNKLRPPVQQRKQLEHTLPDAKVTKLFLSLTLRTNKGRDDNVRLETCLACRLRSLKSPYFKILKEVRHFCSFKVDQAIHETGSILNL